MVNSCEWPVDKSWPPGVIPTHIALIADPQLIDAHTYPGRNYVLERITESVVDYYLRRNWVNINGQLDPDANIFLGDLFDGGREWSDPVWKKEYNRWNQVFPKPPYKRTVMSLPGNHDIGYGNTIVYHALQRFSSYFGDPSSTVEIGNHTIVLLDTISMMNTDNSTIYEKPYTFINDLIKRPNFYQDRPRILMTHVPLFRDPKHPCGRQRESKKPLPYTKGKQYQTQVTPEGSQTILSALRPDAVFSGDDHDACYVLHNYTIAQDALPGKEAPPPIVASAAEYTAKSISMAMGIGHPGIQLLSLYYDLTAAKATEETSSKSIPSFATSICYMPNPFKAFIIYFAFAFLSAVIVLAFNFMPEVFPPIVHILLSRNKVVYSSLPLQEKEESFNDDPEVSGMYTSDLESSFTNANTRPSLASSNSSSEDKSSTSRPVKQVTFALDSSTYNEAQTVGDSSLSPFSNSISENSRFGEYPKSSTQQFRSTLQRARFKIRQKQLWKKVAKEVAVIAVFVSGFYMFLLYSIYKAPPSAVSI